MALSQNEIEMLIIRSVDRIELIYEKCKCPYQSKLYFQLFVAVRNSENDFKSAQYASTVLELLELLCVLAFCASQERVVLYNS